MNAENFKNVIIGSGEGGKYLAWHLAQSGERTAVVERRWVGGSCPNVNCLPSKNEICSAKVAELVHRGADSGFRRIVPHRTWWLFKSENARWLKG